MGAREDPLIKHSCVADEGLLALQIIELPALVVWRVSNEDALPGVGAKACSLVLLHMDIGQAAKDTQVGEIRLEPMPELVGGAVLHRGSGGSVVHMHKAGESMQPEGGRQVGLLQQGCGALSQSPVGPLSNPILVGLIPHSVLSGNASSSQEGAEGCGHVLSTLVISEPLDGAVQLVLCICLESLEGLKGITLLVQGDDCEELAEVINEGDPVLEAFSCAHWKRAMQVRVDQLKQVGGMV